MAYDEGLAERVRLVLVDEPGVSERKMFGGLAFLLEGNMLCGIVGNELMVRVGPDRYQAALSAPHVRPMEFTGRPMSGMVYVAPDGYGADESLRSWVGQALGFGRSLPPKTAAGPRPRKRSK